MSIFDTINNATDLQGISIPKLKTTPKKPKQSDIDSFNSFLSGLGSIFSVPANYKPTPVKPINAFGNTSASSPIGYINNQLGFPATPTSITGNGVGPLNTNPTSITGYGVGPLANPTSITGYGVGPQANPTSITGNGVGPLPSPSSNKTNNPQDRPLSEEEKKLVYQAGLQGGLSSQEASSVSGYIPTKTNTTSKTQTGGRGRPAPKPFIIQEGPYKGLTLAQEGAKKKEQSKQDSPLTSYSFSPESIGNTKKVMDNFQLFLDSNQNNPLTSEGDKQQEKKIKVDLAAKDIAKGFNNPQDFYVASQNNAELQNILKPFIDNGGSLSQIASNITSNVTNTNKQDVGSYLSSLNTNNNNFDVSDPFHLKALNTLFPENELAQKEVMRQANIASELHDLYFGTEDKIGILDEQKKTAEEKIKILNQKELNDKATARDKAQYAIDKNNSDADAARAEIELNRQHAKNYMTGMLAKLGALKTTGTAPLALSTLEQKYQQQKQRLDTKLKFANRETELGLTEKINDITTNTDSDIETINEDLSLSSQKAAEKVFAAQQKAETKIYDLTSKAAVEMRKQTEIYRKESKSNSDKYNANFWKLASKGVDVKKIPSLIGADGSIDTSKLTNSIFAKKVTPSNSYFSASDLRKLKRAGINPNTQLDKAISFIDSSSQTSIKPDYTGETLKLNNRLLKGFLKLGPADKIKYTEADLIKVQNLLLHGYSLKQIAKQSGMSTSVFNYLNNHLKTN